MAIIYYHFQCQLYLNYNCNHFFVSVFFHIISNIRVAIKMDLPMKIILIFNYKYRILFSRYIESKTPTLVSSNLIGEYVKNVVTTTRVNYVLNKSQLDVSCPANQLRQTNFA